MAYYKVRIEVWCNWDPEASGPEEIVENIRAGDDTLVLRDDKGNPVWNWKPKH